MQPGLYSLSEFPPINSLYDHLPYSTSHTYLVANSSFLFSLDSISLGSANFPVSLNLCFALVIFSAWLTLNHYWRKLGRIPGPTISIPFTWLEILYFVASITELTEVFAMFILSFSTIFTYFSTFCWCFCSMKNRLDFLNSGWNGGS